MSVVFVNGVFDLLHEGHLWFLNRAATFGSRLVVGINSDQSTRRLKGDGRPVVPALGRVWQLRELACVADVIVFHDDTPLETVVRLRPDVLVKGEEYVPGGKLCPERLYVEAYQGRVVYLPRAIDISTSRIIAVRAMAADTSPCIDRTALSPRPNNA